MIEFAHITSLASALAIMRSLTFHPIQPDGGDAGLNGLAVDRRPARTRQHFEGLGVYLFFEWSGPIWKWDDLTDGHRTWDPQPNILIDQMPFRVFVPNGTMRHLTLTGLEVKPEAWEEQLEFPPSSAMLGWRIFRRRIKFRIEAEIEQIAKLRPNVTVRY